MRFFVLLLVVLLLVLASCSSEPSGPRVVFNETSFSCGVGDVVSVPVVVRDVSDVSAFQLSLVLSSDNLVFDSFEEGSFLKSVRDTFVVNPKVDGLVVGPVAVAQLGGGGVAGSGASGSGVLGVFNFKCRSKGKVSLSFSNVKFVSPPGKVLSVLPFGSASVRVR